jgi:hypothetical protein
MSRFIIAITFILLSLSQPVLGQQEADSATFKPQYIPGIKYVFKTSFGTTHTGYVTKETKDAILIEHRSIHGTMQLNKSDIISAKPMENIKQPEENSFGDNNHADSYMFSSSAFTFDEGGIVSRNHWLLMQNIDYSFTENFAFTTSAIAFLPYCFGLKGAFRMDDLNYAGGSVFAIGNIFSNNQASVFGAYGLQARYTHGTSNNNFTFAAGLIGISNTWLPQPVSKPIVNVGFLSGAYCNRFSKRVAFIAEGWYFPSSLSVINGLDLSFIGGIGIKLVGNDYYSWSFGCYSFLDTYDNNFRINRGSFPIPYVGIVRKFSQFR